VSSTDSEWIAAAESYLVDCMNDSSPPRASELAARLSITPVQLTREFRGSVGSNISSFLKGRQIELAKLLLARTNLGTAEIASRAGFGTARTFYRAFRRNTGMTPTRFRSERNVAGRT
jgi:AraC-like DNA-binding protein